jgi:RHS repeat-associated protein
MRARRINMLNNCLTTNMKYDAAGNVTVDGKFNSGQQYLYDGNGRQRWTARVDGTQSAVAFYDGLGQRVQTTSGTQTMTLVYDQFGQMVAEYGGANTGTGAVKYVMSDVQGSSRVVMNSSAAVTARHDYLPFGEEIKIGTVSGMRTTGQGYEQADSLRQKYAGMERDESGVDHTLWRKYESRAGRCTSPDPYSGSMSVSDPQSFNRYAYVGNDPINRIDPKGLEEIWFPDGIPKWGLKWGNWQQRSGGRNPRPQRRVPGEQQNPAQQEQLWSQSDHRHDRFHSRPARGGRKPALR